mmetsp:Transcript_19974/g.43714  ORF Transcript_19974/g.43714 Transcript_19974/m.43714 type:complete len:223 (+) Transcript_19974:321-989(+)
MARCIICSYLPEHAWLLYCAEAIIYHSLVNAKLYPSVSAQRASPLHTDACRFHSQAGAANMLHTAVAAAGTGCRNAMVRARQARGVRGMSFSHSEHFLLHRLRERLLLHLDDAPLEGIRLAASRQGVRLGTAGASGLLSRAIQPGRRLERLLAEKLEVLALEGTVNARLGGGYGLGRRAPRIDAWLGGDAGPVEGANGARVIEWPARYPVRNPSVGCPCGFA